MKLAYRKHDIKGKCQNSKIRHFQCQSCGTVHDFELRCNKRFEILCPDCADHWRRSVVTKFKLGIANMQTPKFVTLTLKKGADLDVRYIWKMRNYLFKILRRRGYRIDGWLGVCEWPNHIHLVIDSDYVPQEELSKAWLASTDDSYIVDIRAVKDGRGERMAINYLAKYLGKSQGWDDANLSLLKGFHLQNNHGLILDKPVKRCPCDCGIGPLRLVTEMEWDHSLSFIIDYDSDK
jgi:hypothetical protein